MRHALLVEHVDLSARRQGNDAIAIRMSRHHIECRTTNAAGGTENGNAAHELAHQPNGERRQGQARGECIDAVEDAAVAR